MPPLTLKSTSPLPEAGGQLDPHCQCTPKTAHWACLWEILPPDSLEWCSSTGGESVWTHHGG